MHLLKMYSLLNMGNFAILVYRRVRYTHHSNIIHGSIFVAILPEDVPQRASPSHSCNGWSLQVFGNDESGRVYPSVDLIIAMETKNPSLSSGNSHWKLKWCDVWVKEQSYVIFDVQKVDKNYALEQLYFGNPESRQRGRQGRKASPIPLKKTNDRAYHQPTTGFIIFCSKGFWSFSLVLFWDVLFFPWVGSSSQMLIFFSATNQFGVLGIHLLSNGKYKQNPYWKLLINRFHFPLEDTANLHNIAHSSCTLVNYSP